MTAPWPLFATTTLPPCNPRKLTRQIRQDVWRKLQKMRGFRPQVLVTERDGMLHVQAGGPAMHPNAKAQNDLQDVLDDPQNRMRWVNYARAGWQV